MHHHNYRRYYKANISAGWQQAELIVKYLFMVLLKYYFSRRGKKNNNMQLVSTSQVAC